MYKHVLMPFHCSRKNELKGLRIDAAIENPVTGETKWTDVSVMHTTLQVTSMWN